MKPKQKKIKDTNKRKKKEQTSKQIHEATYQKDVREEKKIKTEKNE